MVRKAKILGILLAFCMMSAVCVPFVSAVDERPSEPAVTSADILVNEPVVGGWSLLGGGGAKERDIVLHFKKIGLTVQAGTTETVSEIGCTWDDKGNPIVTAQDRKTGEWRQVYPDPKK